MIINKQEKEQIIKCPLCGYSFKKGQNNACGSCPLNYGSCNFERCPNCGYDIPQRSDLWTFAEKVINKFKGRKK